MFTGIIEETGRVTAVETVGGGLRIAVRADRVLKGTGVGDSIAVDGVCLTVEDLGRGSFTCFLSAETSGATTLGRAAVGREVNLERAMALGDRFGGHLVSGHVEATGSISGLERVGEGRLMTVAFELSFAPYVVHKGSVSVDGVSLTIAATREDAFEVAIIPETWQKTTFRLKTIGDFVNLEPDLILKYVRSSVDGLIEKGENRGLTLDQLFAAGFLAGRKG